MNSPYGNRQRVVPGLTPAARLARVAELGDRHGFPEEVSYAIYIHLSAVARAGLEVTPDAIRAARAMTGPEGAA